MTQPESLRTSPLARSAPVLAAALGIALWAFPAHAAPDDVDQEIDTCMTCHADQSMTLELPDGSKPSLAVDAAAFRKSIHGAAVRCTDCHTGYAEIPHPERKFKSGSDFHASFREACKRCHFEEHSRSLDGIHFQLASRGETMAPTCTDCHGVHDVQKPNEPRTRISDLCSGCHSDVAEVYLKSVHGKALVAGKGTDVPVCTDCHRSHDIADPRTESWLIKTPQLCGKCHSDAPLMKKYGLSTSVVKTYLSDFHGMSAGLSRAHKSQATDAPRVTALCIDCHGVHDIISTKDPNSPVLKANLVKTCRKCHPQASENFPGAWLSHYEPSWDKAPLVYAIKVFYTILIPFMIGALCLQILLHLWRVVVNR